MRRANIHEACCTKFVRQREKRWPERSDFCRDSINYLTRWESVARRSPIDKLFIALSAGLGLSPVRLPRIFWHGAGRFRSRERGTASAHAIFVSKLPTNDIMPLAARESFSLLASSSDRRSRINSCSYLDSNELNSKTTVCLHFSLVEFTNYVSSFILYFTFLLFLFLQI